MRQVVSRHNAQLGHDTARARQLGTLGTAGGRIGGAGRAALALACGTGSQQAQAALGRLLGAQLGA